MGWWRISDESLNDRLVQTLPPEEFKRKFFACLKGETNEFSRFVEPEKRRLDISSAEWIVRRAAILERDHHACAYCCDPAEEVDHIIPLCRGGLSQDDNLTAACVRCNRSKGGLTPWEWEKRDNFKLPPWWHE